MAGRACLPRKRLFFTIVSASFFFAASKAPRASETLMSMSCNNGTWGDALAAESTQGRKYAENILPLAV